MSKNLILSYQKSGLNFIRYCVEFLTKEITPGRTRLIPSSKPKKKQIYAFRRSHYSVKTRPDENLIILIRDYRELACRPFGDSPASPQSREERIKDLSRRYKSFFKIYEKHQGKKAIIYYEDLIENLLPITEIILKVFDLNIKEDLDLFIRNEKKHREKSFTLGNRRFSDGYSKKFHQRKASASVLAEMENFMKNELGELSIYLDRYSESLK